MDVLFGSIDVRELLPAAAAAAVPPQKLGDSGDEDPAAIPLSAPDLRLLVDRLNVRSLRIKDQVREYVFSHRDDFARIFTRCADVACRADALSDDLSRALRVLSAGDDEHPIDVQIRDLANDITRKTRELAERRTALALIQKIVALLERLETARQDARGGRFLRAAEGVRDLKEALLIPENAEEGRAGREDEPMVYGLLRQEWDVCLDELQTLLARLVESAVRFEPENGTVIVSSRLSVGHEEAYEFRSLLEAMDIINSLNYGLAKVADLMIKHIVTPVICNRCTVVLIEDVNGKATEKAEAALKLLPPSECQEFFDVQSIYSRLLQVIRFIDKYVVHQNAKWMLAFGRLTWSRISELVITFCLSKVVPEDASKFTEFHDIMKRTADFEASLKEIGFISATDSQGEKLTLFGDNVEVHFASRKKSAILGQARSLILQCDFSFSQASGVDKNEHIVNLLFQPDTCLVSSAAFHLIKLVHRTLKDVCLSSARVALEFYHAARDVLLLYKAIVPVKLEKQLGTISQEAAIIHNDCLYLSQEVGGLAFEYRANFPRDVKERAIFVDMELDFHQMAEDTLGKQVELVILSLKEAIDGANGFQNTHQVQGYELAKFSVDQVVFIMEKLHIIWDPVLPRSTYRRIMCMLLDFVFSTIMKDMLLLDDIAAEETLHLQQVIHLILDSLSPLSESLVESLETSSKDTFSKENHWIQFDERIPSLRKFRKLADLLDLPLKSITASWESGELNQCGFASSEVINFVKAIFTDSPLRKECLWRIESRSF